jgi:urate oxidase
MRKYEVIWEKIKQAADNAPEDQWVHVNCSSVDMIQTVINMVQVEKSTANVARKGLDLPQFGRLVIKREPEIKRVSFQLKNSGASL